jgi:putative endonuclease
MAANPKQPLYRCRPLRYAKRGLLVESAMAWWLYVLECRGGVLYTGIARDVEARFEAHSRGAGARFTRRNRPVRILARAPVATQSEALRAEFALKKLSRAGKLRWCAEGLDRFIAAVLPAPASPRGSAASPG